MRSHPPKMKMKITVGVVVPVLEYVVLYLLSRIGLGIQFRLMTCMTCGPLACPVWGTAIPAVVFELLSSFFFVSVSIVIIRVGA